MTDLTVPSRLIGNEVQIHAVEARAPVDLMAP